MRWFTVPALLAAAGFSAVVVIPFLPAAKPRPHLFALEARIASTTQGVVKIYFDIGDGYSETHASEHVLARTGTPQLYRFALPLARYHSIRFDPIDGPGTAILEGPLRIVSESGRVVRTISHSELRPLEQIEGIREAAGRLEIVAGSMADDPQLVVTFSPPLVLGLTLTALAGEILPRALVVFIALSALLLAIDRAPRMRATIANAGGHLAAHSPRAIAIAAAAAVIASAYPVVFLGKSFVSPNFGTTLLYETFPTLPGYTSADKATVNGADVGATMWQHVPYAFIQRRALERGELPWWNRYNSAGTPLLAQGQSMFGDPLHVLVIAANGAAWAWDVKFLLAKWLLATGLGLIVLALAGAQTCCALGASAEGRSRPAPLRTMGGTPALLPALLVTLAAPFIGFFLYRINHPAIFSVCYAPWVLYCWIRIAHASGRRPGARWMAGLFVANLALMNSGTAKEAWLLLLQMNAAGACVLLASADSWRVRLAKLAGAAWTGALLLLITAPVWYTFLQTLSRSYTAYAQPGAFQIQPALLLGAFDELFFRPLSQEDIVFNPSLNLFLLLGLLYFLATLRLHFAHRTVMALAACALVSLAFAFGVVPPHGIARVPLLANVSHIENCFLGGFIVFGSVLAGIGFATAASRLRTAEGRGDLAIAGMLLFVLVAAWIGFRQASHRMVYGPGTTFSVLQPGHVIAVSPFIWGGLASLLLASGVLGLTIRHAATRGRFGAAHTMVAALCVIVLLWRHGMHASTLGFETYLLQPPVRASFHAASPAIDFVRAGQQHEPGRVFGLHGNVTPGWNAVYSLETIYGPDGLQNPWLRELIDVSPVKWNSAWRVYLASPDAANAQPFLDALNVRYYFDLGANPPPAKSALQHVRSADLEVYESRTAWPRAFFAGSLVDYAEPTDLMKMFLASNGRPRVAVHRDDLAANPALSALRREAGEATGATESAVTPATRYRLTTNTTAFDVRASGPGLVVLTEAWWPDSFRAEINGRPAPIVRVNHAFKAVRVDAAGDYRVTFRYWPRRFTRNLTFSGIGIGLLALSLFLALRPVRSA